MFFTQLEIFHKLFPLILENGNDYKKTSLVLARRAFENEYIETWTHDGLETTNYAKLGDFIIKNLQTEFQEEYIISEKTFFSRYKFFYWHDEFHGVFIPTGTIRACEYLGDNLTFKASWGREMVLKTGDYIASAYPAMDEIYRIAAKEFYETYEMINLQ